jgi:hypothetical protein
MIVKFSEPPDFILSVKQSDVLFAVPSCININYNFPRATNVYSDEDRYNQTIDQLKSIRQKVPDATIILLDCSYTPIEPDKLCTLENLCDCIILFDDGEIFFYCHFLMSNYKSLGEMSMLMFLYREIHSHLEKVAYKWVIKFGGRYKLTDQFDISKFLTTRITVKRSLTMSYFWVGNMVPCIVYGTDKPDTKPYIQGELFSVPVRYLADVVDIVTPHLDRYNICRPTEVLLSMIDDKHPVNFVDTLGIDGCSSVNGNRNLI